MLVANINHGDIMFYTFKKYNLQCSLSDVLTCINTVYYLLYLECPDGSFGDGCALNCGECKSDLPCDKATGQCDACAAGYKGFACFESEYIFLYC